MSEAVIAIGDYIRFYMVDSTPVPLRNYQNFFVDQSRSWQSVTYLFAPFGLDGDTSVRAGETPQSVLVSVQNALTISMFVEAVKARYLVEVEKVAIQMVASSSPPRFQEQASLGKQRWSVTGYEMASDGETVSLRLAGPRNAVDRQVPHRRLTSELVGALPPTGNIFTT